MANDQIITIFNHATKNVQALDFNDLSNKYHARRNSFLKMLDNNQHNIINSKLVRAVISTDICLEISQEFFESLSNKVIGFQEDATQELSNFQVISDGINKNLENLLKDVQSKEKEGFSDAYLDSIQMLQNAFGFAFQQQKGLREFSFAAKALSVYLISINLTLNYNSLYRLLDTTDLKLVGDVLVVIIKGLIGIFPAGSVATLLWDMYEVSKKQAEQYKKAGDLLTQLDNYSNTAFQWCVLTQMLIEVNEKRLSIDFRNKDLNDFSYDKTDMEHTVKIVEARFEIFMRNLNSAISG